MKLSLIVAQGENRAIGKDNQLLWHLPNDLKFFKHTTLGKPVIMGRKTYESIGRPLPGRLNIVVSRHAQEYPADVRVVPSLEQAIETARQSEALEAMIIGGGMLYEQALDQVDTLYVTQVQATIDADVFFPEINSRTWSLVWSEPHESDDKHRYHYEFRRYERQQEPS